MSISDGLATRLRSERQKLGMTQARMAENLGLPAVTYRTYEYGRSEPPASFFVRLLEKGVDAHYVFTGETAAELLGKQFDWPLFVEVAELIREWSESRPRPLDVDERAKFLRVTYGWASRLGREAALTMLDELMELAA